MAKIFDWIAGLVYCLVTLMAQTLYSGIFAIGSTASMVSMLAGPSPK